MAFRPDDTHTFRQALRLAHKDSSAPVLFAGRTAGADAGALVLDSFLGVRTDLLNGLRVERGRGVGGYVLASGSVYTEPDYGSSRTITHDYDAAVLGEGLRTLVAAPVTVTGRVRGVLYAGTRSDAPLGGRAADVLVAVSRRLAGELRVQDEVDRRLRLLQHADFSAPASPDEREQVRSVRRELLELAESQADPALRERLRDLGERLAGPPALAPVAPVRLTARERDVLAEVALGCTNAEAAQRLALGAETVKAYLRSATRKLGVHDRHHAVQAARALGLLTATPDRG